MKHNSDFLQNFMAYYKYPEIAVTAFTRVLERLDNEPDFAKGFDKIVDEYLKKEKNLDESIRAIESYAQEYGENMYTLDFVFLLCCQPTIKQRYLDAGISEQIYLDSMDDLRCKLLECIDVMEVPGTFVAGWYRGFMDVERFALGRFQFEYTTYDNDGDYVTKCGKVLHNGDTLIGFHIPSSGIPLTDEVRYDAYRRAYEFFKKDFPDGKVVFCCGSWLLYPGNKEILPADSNVIKFIDDFEILHSEERDEFGDAWRIFGKYASRPVSEWPRDTKMRKAFAEWIESGHKTGNGDGVFVFDGEKILK